MKKPHTTSEKKIKFLVDCMLGKLAKWLRIFGYDTIHDSVLKNPVLIFTARKEGRILLTRNTQLIKKRNLGDFLFIKSNFWDEQLIQIIKELNLIFQLDSSLFSRCTICNSKTIKVEKNIVQNHVPPYVFKNNDEFVFCPFCHKYYWKGTHWQRMDQTIREIKEKSSM